MVGDPADEPRQAVSHCNNGAEVSYSLADNVRRVLRHSDNTVLRFGGPRVLDSTSEERRVERENFTEPSKVNLFTTDDKSHELLLDIGAGSSLEHDVAIR